MPVELCLLVPYVLQTATALLNLTVDDPDVRIS